MHYEIFTYLYGSPDPLSQTEALYPEDLETLMEIDSNLPAFSRLELRRLAKMMASFRRREIQKVKEAEEKAEEARKKGKPVKEVKLRVLRVSESHSCYVKFYIQGEEDVFYAIPSPYNRGDISLVSEEEFQRILQINQNLTQEA